MPQKMRRDVPCLGLPFVDSLEAAKTSHLTEIEKMPNAPENTKAETPTKNPRYWDIFFWFLAAGIVFLLLFSLDSYPGLNGDEAYQGLLSAPMESTTQHGSFGWRMFTTKAPSGRYPHPLLASSIYALEQAYPPSAWTLRLPVVIWSLLGCLLLFVLTRRMEGNDAFASWSYLLIFASHPLFLSYARFAWEPSLYVVGVVLFWVPWFFDRSVRKHPSFWGMLFFGAILTLFAHPVYLVFLVCAVSVLAWMPQNDEQPRSPSLIQSVVWGLWAAIFIIGLIWMVVQMGVAALGRFSWQYLQQLAEILSGMRALQYITGISWGIWHGLLLCSFSLLCFASFLGLFRKNRERLRHGVIFFTLSFICYFFLQLYLPLTIGQERYILVLIFPVCFFLASGLQQYPLFWKRLVLGLHVSFCLVAFVMGYFVQGWRTENRYAHPTFWSGSSPQDAEPKEKIADWLKKHLPPQAPIFTSNFWMEKTLAYRLGRPIKMFWQEGQFHAESIHWKTIPHWVVVDFHLQESPIWPLMRYFDQHKIAYQKYRVTTQRGRIQAWIIRSGR